MKKELKVLVADDHRLIVDMMEVFLTTEGDFKVQTANTLARAIDIATADPDFDVILLDLDMPGMNGLTGFERMIAAAPDTAVVLFSGNVRLEALEKVMRLGVRGYIPKTLATKSLISAIRFVAAGETYYPADMLRTMVAPRQDSPASKLSGRECDVLRELVSGSTNKEISSRIGVPETTVKMCVRSVCQKLEVSNRTQAAMAAVARGLV
ncbi:DNA-binding response regulator [Gemmobacter aquarius]|uniref:DNA-binding response regulator n=1 Tax=Paragemmobacter aquarius TaxID=2169400 RepID=A0A2S0UMX8_9RHOB|nr:response regulator transcription factor [Gemmobacter aquarius]AWB49168.1 DNA-binding response regulator [Gemmobacter aquarius]